MDCLRCPLERIVGWRLPAQAIDQYTHVAKIKGRLLENGKHAGASIGGKGSNILIENRSIERMLWAKSYREEIAFKRNDSA